MSYPITSHLSDREIRLLIGSACYTDIALATGGEWHTNKLEEMVNTEDKDGNTYYSEYSGLFRGMRNGRIPGAKTSIRIQNILKTNSFSTWIDLPLWPLLYNYHYEESHILNALNSLPKEMRDIIFVDGHYDPGLQRLARHEVTVDMIKKISKYENLHALVAVTAFARESRQNNIHRISAFSSFATQELFPKVICKTPQLYIRWPKLAEIYQHIFWEPPKTATSVIWLGYEKEKLVSEIENEEKNAISCHIQLPPKHIFRSINKTHLY